MNHKHFVPHSPLMKYKLFHNKKRGIANLVCITRFWNNLHQVRLKSKDWKSKKFNVLGAIKTSSTLPRLDAPVSSQANERPCTKDICVLRVAVLPLLLSFFDYILKLFREGFSLYF
jgi:hypothetical protein